VVGYVVAAGVTRRLKMLRASTERSPTVTSTSAPTRPGRQS
jgi:hypothetical protein